MSAIVRLLNRIDRTLDRAIIHAPVEINERLRGGGVPCLVSHALERSVREAHRHDEDARLKHVIAPQGAQPDGASRRWEFVFDLPQRRAKLLSQWYLDGDAIFGRFGRECFDAKILPFPPPEHPMALAVAAGKASYSNYAAAWREERKRTPDLPLELRDSDAVIDELQRQGLLVEAGFSLRNALTQAGSPIWLAQAKGASFHIHATQRERVYAHSWTVGDTVMWDNRSTLHRGRRFDIEERRELRRTTINDTEEARLMAG